MKKDKSKSKRSYLLISLTLAFIVAGIGRIGSGHASGGEQQQEQTLRVVTKEIEPFVIKEQDELTGFSIELWKEIALVTGLPFEFVEVETVTDQFDALADGSADVAIAAISMTPEREEQFDFSYAYFRSGLQIMTRGERPGIIRQLFAILFKTSFLDVILVLLIILVVIGHIVWLVERRHNPDFPQRYWPGIWEGLWWSVVTVTTVGYGDKKVRGVKGRVLGMFWMFAGIFLIANFTAIITSELTVSELNTTINGPEDLPGKRVTTLAGTTSANYLRTEGIPFRSVETIERAYQLLESGLVDAIVYDAPVLQYYSATAGDGTLRVVGSPFNREDYGIAFPSGSPYEEQINRALLKIKVSGTYEEIAKRWFISEDG